MSQTAPENQPEQQQTNQQTQQAQQQAAATPAAPQRPDGISETEWNSLGDPGRVAITREREARQAAERALAASRARPAPPAQQQTTPPQAQQQPAVTPAATKPEGDQPDLATVVQKAVEAAMKPLQDAEVQRTAEAAAQRVADAVMEAAKDTFWDPTDALTGIDVASITDGNGNADSAKIKTAIDDLLTRKPHLGKVPDTRRYAPPGGGAGAGGSTVPMDRQVQDILGRMQASAGLKTPTKS